MALVLAMTLAGPPRSPRCIREWSRPPPPPALGGLVACNLVHSASGCAKVPRSRPPTTEGLRAAESSTTAQHARWRTWATRVRPRLITRACGEASLASSRQPDKLNGDHLLECLAATLCAVAHAETTCPLSLPEPGMRVRAALGREAVGAWSRCLVWLLPSTVLSCLTVAGTATPHPSQCSEPRQEPHSSSPALGAHGGHRIQVDGRGWEQEANARRHPDAHDAIGGLHLVDGQSGSAHWLAVSVPCPFHAWARAPPHGKRLP